MASRDAERLIWIPLNAQKSEIRLLRLEPALKHDADLLGSFETLSLEYHPRYDAISHAWGPPGPSELFFVKESLHPLPVPSGLARCLRQLRLADQTRVLWVDALCIAQHDLVKRAQQVRLMQQIFSYAMNVRIWLGSGSVDVTRGFVFLKEMVERQPEAQTQDIWGTGDKLAVKDTPQYASFAALARIAWWDRLWVVQEAILARGLFLHYDNVSVDCGKLKDLARKLAVPKGIVSNVFIPSTFLATSAERDIDRDFRKALFNLVSVYELSVLLKNVSGLGPADKAGVLGILFCENRMRFAHDPRDRVYGMLGVCNALFGDFMDVSYKTTVEQVYTEFAKSIILKSGSLEILNQASNRYTTTMDIPSWVPDWASTYDHAVESFRLNTNRLLLQASGPGPWPQPRVNGRQLVCGGFLVDEVVTVDDCIVQRPEDLRLAIPRWFKYGMRSVSKIRFLENIVLHMMPETISCIAVSSNFIEFTWTPTDGRSSEKFSWTREETFKVWVEAIISFIAFRAHTLNDSDEVDAALSFMAISKGYEARRKVLLLQLALEKFPIKRIVGETKVVLQSLYFGMAKSKFFMPKNHAIGVSSSDVRPGDVIAILAGANVPIMLRKGPVRNGTQTYSIVGEVYMDGWMSGKKFTRSDGTQPPWKDICLE